MAEHSTVFTGPETQEAFLADRERFAVIVLLVGMAVFLL